MATIAEHVKGKTGIWATIIAIVPIFTILINNYHAEEMKRQDQNFELAKMNAASIKRDSMKIVKDSAEHANYEIWNGNEQDKRECENKKLKKELLKVQKLLADSSFRYSKNCQ